MPPDVIQERSSKPESVTPPENESLQQQTTYVSIHSPLEVVSRSIDLHNTYTYIPTDLLDWKEKKWRRLTDKDLLSGPSIPT